MINVILFDVDGVLIKRGLFSEQLEKKYGITKEMTSGFFQGPFKECIIGKVDLKEVIAPYLKEWGWKGTVAEFLDCWFEFSHHIDNKLLKYIQDFRRKGVKCFLATNQEKYRAQYIKDQMGFSQKFDNVYVSSHLGCKKPSQEFYKRIIKDLEDIKKEEILFWDDTPENVEAARQVGIEAEVYTSFNDFQKRMQSYF